MKDSEITGGLLAPWLAHFEEMVMALTKMREAH